MAATAKAARGTDERSTAGATTALLRFLTAALAGGAVLLLWGSTAGAEGTAPSPAASPTADTGLLSGVVGDGAALAPVIDLVDATTGSLTGSRPVGSTVAGAVGTVDPIVTPVTAPVTAAIDPVVAPVLGTAAEITTTVVEPITAGLPTTPAIPPVVPPVGPVDPPVIPPAASPIDATVSELPPLRPPGSAADPGTTSGSVSGSAALAPIAAEAARAPARSSMLDADRSAGGHALLVADHEPLAGAGGPDGRLASTLVPDGAPTTDPGGPAEDRSTDPDGVLPATCSGSGHSASSASAAPGYLASPTALVRCGATSLESPAGIAPRRAPAAGPDVAPD